MTIWWRVIPATREARRTVKKRELSPWFHQTARILGLSLDDQDRRSPTYPGDGRLCIRRLKKPEHVVHEYAHFIDAIQSRRAQPNYGLGTDPDGGPEVAYSDMLNDDVGAFIEQNTTFLTFLLMVEADLPWGRHPAWPHWCDVSTPEKAELSEQRVSWARYHYEHRGINIWDVTAHFRAGCPDR